MPANSKLDALTKLSPVIVGATLSIALVADWLAAPLWLPYCLAAIVGCFALAVIAARNRSYKTGDEEEPGSAGKVSWVTHELAGNGSPPGFYLLGFFGFVTVMLTGVEGAYALPGWAGLALCAAWGIANARYPQGDGSDL